MTACMPLDPQRQYVHLDAGGDATPLAGGEAFWSLPDAELDAHGKGWLVAEFEFDADWVNWEVHPEGDEYVYLLAGALDLLVEHPDGVRTVALAGRGAFVIPRGLWHTAKVHSPSRMLHVTRGSGTQHRPA